MTARALRAWSAVHTWTSLACTLFALVVCLSGLPLLFADEIEDLLTPQTAAAAQVAKAEGKAPRASLDPMVREAQRRRPGEVVAGIFLDPDKPEVQVHMAPSMAADRADPGVLKTFTFDARTGALKSDPAETRVPVNRIERFIFLLHSQLLSGPAGLAVMACAGTALLLAIVSGIVLYAPFMRRMEFGQVRRDRSARVRRLDTHNLFGVVTAAWLAVVGITGVMNELTGPLFDRWQQTTVAPAAARWSGHPLPAGAPLASVQAALDTARRAAPHSRVTGIDYPGASLNSERHYMLWARGATPATAQLFTPVMVDAADGRLTAVLHMPWYLHAIEVSRPFHFGDYGGLPLKVIWALFDLATIWVLVTGLQLWLGRSR